VLSAASHWIGTVTLEDATPSSSCLVAGFQAIGGDRERPARADSSSLTASHVWLHLHTTRQTSELWDDWVEAADPYDGFFPAESYEGRRDGSGAFRLRSSMPSVETMTPSVSSLCTTSWQRLGSDLTGELSADGTRFQGEIVTRYRELNLGNAEFAVRARFDLEQSSYEDSF